MQCSISLSGNETATKINSGIGSPLLILIILQSTWQGAALAEPGRKKADDNEKLGQVAAVIHPLRRCLNLLNTGRGALRVAIAVHQFAEDCMRGGS